jgi:hypothetical protein
MRRSVSILLALGGVVLVATILAGLVPEARAQKGAVEPRWEYKVSVVSFNPGEDASVAQRALAYEKSLNEHAKQGWEPVGSLLSRDTVQTIGGGVTTRDTTSFVAYRRAKR